MREILPIELQDKTEELVEKYVELLHFLCIGIDHGRKRILRAEHLHEKKPTESNEKELNRARKVFPKRSQLRYPSKEDSLLDELERLGLARTIQSSNDCVVSRLVELTEEISDKHHAILKVYKGIYPKRPLHVKTDNAINLLDSMKNLRRRPREILRDAYTEDDHGWAFYVPKWFNEALDIKLIDQLWNTVSRLVWTQGNNFAFKQGDMIYETKQDYELGDARLQVILGQSAEGIEEKIDTDEENSEENPLKERFAGLVKYRDFSNNSEKTVSQDDFVRMLIEGEKQIIEERQGVLF